MRYYVFCKSEVTGIAPHIVAEVVRDRVDDDEITTLASALAGEHRVIATRSELLDYALGRSALKAWDAGDDSAYDEECLALRIGVAKPVRGLRLVKTASAD